MQYWSQWKVITRESCTFDGELCWFGDAYHVDEGEIDGGGSACHGVGERYGDEGKLN